MDVEIGTVLLGKRSRYKARQGMHKLKEMHAEMVG